MHSNTLTPSYKKTVSGTATATEFTRVSEEKGKSVYKTTVCLTDPSLPREQVALGVTEPKATSQTNGVGRADVAVTRDVLVSTPSGGTKYAPIVIRVTTSLPVGASADETERAVELFKAWVALPEFKKTVIGREV